MYVVTIGDDLTYWVVDYGLIKALAQIHQEWHILSGENLISVKVVNEEEAKSTMMMLSMAEEGDPPKSLYDILQETDEPEMVASTNLKHYE